uniref:Uncharacterized protein n=1 Tax=viral metagenome TaxID=1070528 RepID=A0A6C0BJL6_9ZZZZ
MSASVPVAYVVNPETGKKIQVGGPTYLRLKSKYPMDHLDQVAPVYGPARRSATRGWEVDAPKRGIQRHQLREKCGDACFLMPETEQFPVCPRCHEGKCSCQVDCRGAVAAKVRAHQYKHAHLYQIVDRLVKEKCSKARK